MMKTFLMLDDFNNHKITDKQLNYDTYSDELCNNVKECTNSSHFPLLTNKVLA